MNLGKLLAAGKSIMGGRREIAYRVSDRVYLPKFISPKNPFAAASKSEPSPPDMPVPAKKSAVAGGRKTWKRPMILMVHPPGYWLDKFNRLLFRRRSAPRAEIKARGPMQAELSLDRVKVVHNDLSDADVEIVPIKSRTAAGPMEPVETVLASAGGGDSWTRLAAKIFGVKTV